VQSTSPPKQLIKRAPLSSGLVINHVNSKPHYDFTDFEPKYVPGDTFTVVIWDVGNDKWEYGTFYITGVSTSAKYAGQWSYSTECLSGNIKWTGLGCHHLQTNDSWKVKKYLGNIYKDPALKVLYGKA
jgi:hypothetical protein